MKDKTLCEFPLCLRIAVREGFCVSHARFFAGPKAKKLQKKIPTFSKKRIKQNKELGKISKVKITSDTLCQIRAVGCLIKASSLHHLQKRSPGNLIQEDNLIPVCSNCNSWVERFPEQAKKRGFTVSKFRA